MHLVIIAIVVHAHGWGTTVAFLFKEEKSAREVKSKESNGWASIRTTTTRKIVRAKEEADILKTSNPIPKQMTRVSTSLSLYRAKFSP